MIFEDKASLSSPERDQKTSLLFFGGNELMLEDRRRGKLEERKSKLYQLNVHWGP